MHLLSCFKISDVLLAGQGPMDKHYLIFFGPVSNSLNGAPNHPGPVFVFIAPISQPAEVNRSPIGAVYGLLHDQDWIFFDNTKHSWTSSGLAAPASMVASASPKFIPSLFSTISKRLLSSLNYAVTDPGLFQTANSCQKWQPVHHWPGEASLSNILARIRSSCSFWAMKRVAF